MESSPDAASFEQEPDMFISHLETCKILKSEEKGSSYELRAGRKVCHQCGAAIIELKKGPSRLLTGEEYRIAASSLIKEAQDDLLQYCSGYFACYPEADTIVVFAVGGPFWKWANINRSDTPRWDFALNYANESTPKNKRLTQKWISLFGDSFILGTPASDKELTLINREHIYTLLHHTPEAPVDLLPKLEDEDGEEEGDGEKGEEVWDDENGRVEEEEDQVLDRGCWTDEEE